MSSDRMAAGHYGLKEDELGEVTEVNDVPPSGIVDEDTDEEPREMDMQANESTERLSEMSDRDTGFAWHAASASHSRVATWIRRMRPLMRSKKVRRLASANVVLLFFNAIALTLVLVFFLRIVFMIFLQRNALLKSDDSENVGRCMFKYGPWSDCSEPCYGNPKSSGPRRTRTVLQSTVVRPRYRGSIMGECDQVRNLTETALCNVITCPRKVSEFRFSKNFMLNDVACGQMCGCYAIREIPDNAMVLFDGHKLTEERDCPDFMF